MPLDFNGIPTLAIDLDGTIADEEKVDWPLIGDPLPQAKETLKRFKELGCEILIYSCRTGGRAKAEGTIKDQYKRIIDYLNTHDIPFDKVVLAPEGKPQSDFYIDNKAIEYSDNWEDIGNTIEDWLEKSKTASAKTTPWHRFMKSLTGMRGFTKRDLVAKAALFGISLGPGEILKIMNTMGNVMATEYREMIERIANKIAAPHFVDVECSTGREDIDMFIELYGTGKLPKKYERTLEKYFKTTDKKVMMLKALRSPVIPIMCQNKDVELIDKRTGDMIKKVAETYLS